MKLEEEEEPQLTLTGLRGCASGEGDDSEDGEGGTVPSFFESDGEGEGRQYVVRGSKGRRLSEGKTKVSLTNRK